ncbi:MAG: type II toxin-antitoxin system VapC family toxin [Methylobacillus sp.]|jgi:predicted nucleic acid-binding protein|nr:type II toxin-antitoxin system VapC family toxin [Methylobacillus sp.]
MYVLDTNVVSELRPGKARQSPAVRAWASALPESGFFLSAITLMELEIGLQRIERKDAVQGKLLRAWLDSLRMVFSERVLPFGKEAALLCASLHVPDPRSYRDSMIAATALSHGFIIATRNVRDYEHSGVKLINPWDYKV